MPAVPPGQPIAPGIANPNQYPQWGVGNVGGKWNVIEAANASQKQTDMQKGYLVWFGSKTDADNFAQDQTGFASGNTPNPLSGLAAIGDFFSRLTQANTWIRVAKVLGGGMLLVIGIAHMTGASNAVASAARKVPVPI